MVNAGGRDLEPREVGHAEKHTDRISAFDGHPPDTSFLFFAPDVQRFAVERLLSAETTVFCNLDRATSYSWHLPNLPVPRPIRRKINPFAIPRPGRDIVLEGFGGEATRRAPFSTDDQDIAMAFKAGIESHRFAVQRPAGRTQITGQ